MGRGWFGYIDESPGSPDNNDRESSSVTHLRLNLACISLALETVSAPVREKRLWWHGTNSASDKFLEKTITSVFAVSGLGCIFVL